MINENKNKLPEVGKRYRLCVGMNNSNEPEYIFCEVIRLGNTFAEVLMLHSSIKHFYEKDTFLKGWEEINDKNNFEKRIQKAKEELRESISINVEVAGKYGIEHCVKDLLHSAQAILDALEYAEQNEATYLEPNEIDEKIKEFNNKSIWKDVNQLPKENCFVMIRFKGGDEDVLFGNYREENEIFLDENMKYHYPKESILGYTTLTDFINEHEQLKRDVEMLKGRK